MIFNSFKQLPIANHDIFFGAQDFFMAVIDIIALDLLNFKGEIIDHPQDDNSPLLKNSETFILHE